jgi:hypothetical protein
MACDSSDPSATEPEAGSDAKTATAGSDASSPAADASIASSGVAACQPDASGARDAIPREKCSQEDKLGGFEAVALTEYSSVQGTVANGVLPGSIRTKQLEEGGCIMWKRPLLFCDPACGIEETCDFGGTCIPVPVNQDVGTVTIEGLNKRITMEPRPPGNNYFDTEVPHPLFDLGNEDVCLTTAGGYLGEITLRGVGSEAVAAQAEEWTITRGEDFTVLWNAAPFEARTGVLLTLSVDQHGTTPSSLECEFEDTGEGTLPAAVIDALLDAGVSGFPSGRLTRGTVDSVQVEQGCVEFSVQSHQTVDVSVTGYTPCSGPDTCPGGMTCNLRTYLCEE